MLLKSSRRNVSEVLMMLLVAGIVLLPSSRGGAASATAKSPIDCGWMDDYDKTIPYYPDSAWHAGVDWGEPYNWVGGPWAADTYHGIMDPNYTWGVHACCPGNESWCYGDKQDEPTVSARARERSTHRVGYGTGSRVNARR
jgi:hypothetical protein